MEDEILQNIRRSIKNWWISLLVGIISIGLGIWCFTAPTATFFALTIIFISAFLANGILEIAFAISNRNKRTSGWGWALAVGIFDIIFGIILLANPLIAPAILMYFIAFWLMFQSFWAIGVSIDLQKYKNSGWGWLLLISILGLIASIILIMQPAITGYLAVIFVASSFVFYGIFRIVLAIRLKSLNKFLE